MVIELLQRDRLSASTLDELRRLLPHLTTREVDPAQTASAVLQDPSVTLLVAREHSPGPIEGMVALVVYQVLTGRRARIEDLVVDPSARGRGVGEALMEQAVRLARQAQADVVDLTSNPRRQAAHRLYLRLGFVHWETNVFRLVLDGPPMDALQSKDSSASPQSDGC